MKQVTPGAWPFWPQGYNLNSLGRCVLDGAQYKISKVWTFSCLIRRFLKCFPLCVYVKHLFSKWMQRSI